QHETRHAVGEGRLADAGGTADQPGMWDAAAAIGLEQRLLGLGVAEECGVLARMWRLDLVVGVGVAHDIASSSAIGAVAGSRRSLTPFQIFSAAACRSMLASIRTQRFGSVNASMRKASRSFSWNSSDSPSNRSACPSPRRRVARAKPWSAGTSRIKVRSGLR